MDYMIVSKLIFCLERVIWTTRVEIHTPDVPLGDSEFHPLHPRFPSDAWEHRGRWVVHLFQVEQEIEPER